MLTFLATFTIVIAIVVVMIKAKKPEVLDGQISVQPGANLSTYWVIASGSIIVSLKHLVKPMYHTDIACRTTLMT